MAYCLVSLIPGRWDISRIYEQRNIKDAEIRDDWTKHLGLTSDNELKNSNIVNILK